MDDPTNSLLAIGGVIVAVVGVVFKFNHTNSAKIKDLHARIDDVKEKYVRRDDLDNRLESIEKGQDRLVEKVDKLLERK